MLFKRILITLFSVWLTGLATWLVLVTVFPSLNHFDNRAVVGSISLALAAAVGLARGYTYRERILTPKDLEDGFTVRRSVLLLVMMVFFGAVSLGVGALIFWMLTWGWPRRMDPEGITTRNGNRIRWKHVDSVTAGRTTLLGLTYCRWWEIGSKEWQGLETIEVQTRIVPGLLWDGYAALEYAEKSLGRSIR